MTDEVDLKQEPADGEASLGAERAKDEASGAPKLGLKLETYGLVVFALVTSAFYIVWLVVFCVGATRVPHN